MKWIWVVALITLYACSEQDSGELTGDFLVVKACRGGKDFVFDGEGEDDAGYVMDGEFFALQQQGEVAFIRMQPGGKHLDRTDALIVQVNDIDFVRQRLNQPVFFDNPQVRASLHLLGSCPDTSQATTAANGYIEFTTFGVERDDRVAAELEFDLHDERTGEVVGLGFEGSFDFTVKVGQPYQPFSRYNIED